MDVSAQEVVDWLQRARPDVVELAVRSVVNAKQAARINEQDARIRELETSVTNMSEVIKRHDMKGV